MTGMSMSGKMSVGIRRIVTTPRMAMSIDITTNVYGRLSGRRTSHIMLAACFPGPPRCVRCGTTVLGCEGSCMKHRGRVRPLPGAERPLPSATGGLLRSASRMPLAYQDHTRDPDAWAKKLGVSRDAVDLYLA